MNLLCLLFLHLILFINLCVMGHQLHLFNKIETFKTAISTTDKLIQKHGFSVEKHQVKTSDGYVLNTFRIPAKITKNNNPVLLLGSLSATPASFAIYNHSLAYVLARKGYDVWFGNVRGNTIDSKHVKYSKLSKKFWDFSWDEMAAHDLPSTIDYILTKTNRERLFVISLSISTTYTSALLASKPEYNHKVKRHIALAPVLYGRYSVDLGFKTLAKYHVALRIIDQYLGNGAITLIINKLMYYVGTLFCTFFTNQCEIILILINGYTPLKHGKHAAIILANVLHGTSLKMYIHLFQLLHEGPMRHFDYGKRQNHIKYGSQMAPIYDLTNIKTPTSLFHGANDVIATPLTVDIASKRISNVKVELFDNRMFIHDDYVDTVNASQLGVVNREILNHLEMD